jgi:hypothetical protein
MTIAEMGAMIPPKPPELEMLNPWVGTWDMTGVANMSMVEEPVKMTGRTVAVWEGDGSYLALKSTMQMEGFDQKMHMFETVTYNSHSKRFRSTFTDSMGGTGAGQMRYNKKTNTWNMKASAFSPFGKTAMRGSAKFTDNDTIEWSMTEYAMGGLIKTTEMTGTSKRVR